MTLTSSLARRVRDVGILPAYDDVFKQRHEASEATLRAVLEALGADEDDARDERASDLLEPVYVFTDDVPRIIALADSSEPAAWTLVREDERIERGALPPGARELPLPPDLGFGYHTLTLERAGRSAATTVIVAPRSCRVPPRLEHGRLWALAVQVYGLRSKRNWGMGDFEDLRVVCEAVRDAGGAAVAVNPLHWLARGASSPYGPVSRLFVNWLYLDVEQLPGAEPGDVERSRIEAARAAARVDYELVYDLKAEAARKAYDRFRASNATALRSEFERYRAKAGHLLNDAATFAALGEHFVLEGYGDDWRAWPEPYRSPRSDDVEAFAREREDEVTFFAYLQWQCDVQLARVARACEGMPIGLYRDLAVGSHLGGFDTWSHAGVVCARASVGAPPDLFNRAGQNWGVAPFDPPALRAAAYGPFIELLRANTAHAGALRIDHVMGLLRLWFVPEGFSAADGAYVSYPLDDLLAVLALESSRAGFIVVGEDLGTVPDGFRERLERAGVLSYRVLQFEHDDDAFVPPPEYPDLALVATGTHDLPTMAAYWSGTDVDVRARVGALAAEAVAGERARHERERAQLRDAFARAGLEVAEHAPDLEAVHAAYAFLARTPSRLVLVQLEDVVADREQINVPSTTHQYPNWRLRSPIEVESLAPSDAFRQLISVITSS